MRRTLLTMLCLLMMSVATFAAKEDLYVLHADFEEGTSLPEGWTMESVFGDQDWIIESGEDLAYPNGAAVGEGRIALRNTSEQTQGFVTRLITPPMDLSVLTAQPMVIFSHAQPQRLGDVDVLKVYYRTSPEARWIQIAEYKEKITKWQADTIYLDAYTSKTYQIAFEGTDHFGRGIVLDDIIVRPDIVCEDARDIHARSMSGTEAVIEWGGSLDTDSFEVVVSKKLYEKVEDVDWTEDAIIRHDFVYDFTYTLKDLDINTKYYIYIKAYCPTLEGQWVGAEIKTLNKVKLPFVEHFDVEKQATDTLLQVENWTYGTSMKGEDGLTPVRTPFLCAYRTVASWHNYAFSGTAMEFGAGINAKAVPAGEYVYMASPEIDIDRIQDAYVTFWGTGYIYPHLWTSSNDVYSGYIIVGVMTNPADYSTFVPVDTCYSFYYQVFDQFQVKFDKYQGEGKYIAFAVDSKDWITEYWVDEVTIGSVKEPVTPVNFAVKNFTSTSAVVAPELFNATAWNVIASDIKTETPDKLLEKNIIAKAENIPAAEAEKQLAFQNMEGKWLYFYVQTVQGEKKSAWSYSQKYMVPNTLASTSLPKTWDFNTKGSYDSYQLWNYTTTNSTTNWLPDGLVVHAGYYADIYTSSSTAESYAHSGNYGLHINKRNQIIPYVVFPQLDKVQDKLFTFYYAYAMSGTDYPQAIYEVGVMTDPMDTTTFVPVRRYEDGKYNDWKKAEVDFFNYTGDGKYIAVRAFTAADEQSTKMMYGYIEDVTISQFDDCIKPLNITATATDSVVTIKWDANGMTKWAVAISEDWEVDSLMIRDTVETNEAVIKNLKPHTIYTYQVTTLVGTKTSASDRLTVKTECAAFERIPYKESFEGVKVPSGTYTSNLLPDCWTSKQVEANSSGTIYMVPCIYGNSTTSAKSGMNSFLLGYSYTSDSVYAAMPLLELPINKLQMTFYVKSSHAAAVNEPLYIGAMTDPNDIATFDTITTVYITGSSYTEQIINFSKYAGNGKYIAFYKPADIYHTSASSNHYFTIDDIVVDTIAACEKVFEIKVSNIQSNGATFKWNQETADKWQVVVSTKGTLKPADIEAHDASIVIDSIVNTNPFKLADDTIEANTQYYVYVRAVCGNENYGEWITAPVGFKTVCTALDIDNFGGEGKKVEDFSSTSNNGCWTFGKRTSSGTANIVSGHIQLLNTTAASDGSYAISRMLDVDSIQYLQVTFDAWNSSTTYPLNEVTVGIISNPSDLSTFVPLEVVKFDFATDAEDHQAYTVRFNDYFGDYNGDYGQFVMFISESGENTNKIELDNIYFDSIPAWLEPRKVWADSVGADAAIIKWEQMAGADSYELRYADKLANLESASAQVVAADSVRISGLGMLKTYYMQVRAKYGENYSAWSNWRQFTTECPAARPIPFAENFDSYTSASSKNPPQCWGAFESNGNEGANCITPTVYSSAKKDGKNGLYIGGSKTVASYTVLPRLDADLSNAILAFDYKHYSYSYADSLWIGVASSAENLDSILNTVIWVDSIHEKPASSAANVWKEYKRKLAEAVNGEQYVVLKCKANYATYSTITKYGFYIDNMSVEPDATCKKPEAPVAVARELNALGFSWTDTIASAWDVIAVGKGDDAPAMDATPAATVDTTYALITGLTPKTEYDLYVRANCGGGDVSFWVGPATSKTLSTAVYPYFTDFENPTESNPAGTATEKVDEGWISDKALGTGTTGTYFPYVRTNPAAYIASYAGDKALYFNASGSSSDSMYVILPVLVDATNNEVSLDSLQVRFQARQMTVGNGTKTMDMIPFKNVSDGTVTGDPSARHQTATNVRIIQVGTVTNPKDIKTFELLDAFELAPVLTAEKDTFLVSDDPRGNNWWEEISVPFKGTKGKYITILYVTNKVSNTFNIDNLYVEKATGVYAPNAIKGVSSTLNSVTLTWNNRFNAPKFDVGYVAVGGALADVTIVPADKDTFTVTGLEPNKKYDFYVRANYGDTVSNWSAGHMLQTAYEFEQAQAAWTFGKDEDNYRSDKTGNLVPSGWKVGNKNNPATTSYIPKVQINSGTTSLYSKDEKARHGALSIQSFVSSSNNSNGAYAIMPFIKGNLDEKELHFWARCCGGNATGAYSGTYATLTYPRAIKVGYVTDPDNIETFVELADIQLPALSSSSAKYTEDASGNKFWNEISVPLKGMGEGKCIAFLSEYDESNQIYIDQLSIQNAGTCYTPNRPTLDSLGAHAAKFSWQLGEGEWAVLVSTTKNEAQVIRDTVTERSFTVDTLLANTPYIFKVKKLCGSGVESNEASIEFTTNCDLYSQENAVWGFADQLTDMKIGTTTNKVPECWFMSLAVQGSTSYASYCPKAIPNTSSVIYAHDGNATSNYALQFYTTATNYDAYAVMPLMDIDKEKTTLHFYGRAAQFSKTYNTTYKTFLNAANNSYLRKLVVGTMSDPDDPETFIAVDTITYDHVWAVRNQSNLTQDSLDANNSYWTEYTLPLKNYTAGAYIAFKAPKPEAASYFYIDDVAILDAETCTEIGQISAAEITKSSAKLNWTIPQGVENFYVEVSTDKLFEDSAAFILQDTVKALSLELNSLQPATKYYARVKHVCSELQQSEFASAEFTTLYTIRFTENFNGASMPDNWRLYNYADIKPATSSSWEIKSGDNMYGSYASSQIMGSWKRWLETPQIDLSDVVAADSIALSFDLANTNKNLVQEDSVFFLVMVSTDGGLTWPEENRTVWGTTADCDYPLSAISTAKKGSRWMVDLSKYNGQVIRIMFGTDVTKLQGSTGYIYLDNVQLNYYTAEKYAESVCEWTEYEDANFIIDANNLKVGQTTHYEKFTQAAKAAEKDKLAALDLTVTPMAETTMEETLCEGESYKDNSFVIEQPKTGIYRRKLQGVNSCDSVVSLNMTVLAKQYENIEVTICQGAYYEFKGEKYYTNTIKTETFTAANGCDSIVTLYLTVAPILQGETEEVYLCPGQSYHFSDKYPELTEAGLYTDTIQNALGCDSLISVDIKNATNDATLIRAAICPGEVYNDDVFAGLSKAGDYPSQQKNIHGCDSIVTLHLLVATATAEQTIVLNDTVSAETLPYVLNGEELLPAGTIDGIYTKTIVLGCGEATVTINVGNVQGVDMINADGSAARKILFNDNMFIICNDEWYNAEGKKVVNPTK
jgi:hypothetical protein